MTTPLHVDDIKKGDWIIVTDRKLPSVMPEIPENHALFTVSQFEPHGIPFKVHAISLPFLAGALAIDPEVLISLNLSRYSIRRPSKQYVDAYKNFYAAYIAQRQMAYRGQPIQ